MKCLIKKQNQPFEGGLNQFNTKFTGKTCTGVSFLVRFQPQVLSQQFYKNFKNTSIKSLWVTASRKIVKSRLEAIATGVTKKVFLKFCKILSKTPLSETLF